MRGERRDDRICMGSSGGVGVGGGVEMYGLLLGGVEMQLDELRSINEGKPASP